MFVVVHCPLGADTRDGTVPQLSLPLKLVKFHKPGPTAQTALTERPADCGTQAPQLYCMDMFFEVASHVAVVNELYAARSVKLLIC